MNLQQSSSSDLSLQSGSPSHLHSNDIHVVSFLHRNSPDLHITENTNHKLMKSA